MTITEIRAVVTRGKELGRSYYAYGDSDELIVVKAENIDTVVTEVVADIKDKEIKLVVTKFFYFDHIDFSGSGGVL